ncbi:tetratricopeptide repeat protein [Candidatus Poribacteria bacterium]|nr:tetratricopeptide repeat protein [Candidatus Poribacteria bacterium]
MKCKLTDLQSLTYKIILIATLLFIGVSIAVAIGEENSIESAQNLFSQGKYEEALAVLDKFLEAEPNNAEAHAWKGNVLGTLSQRASDMMQMMQYGMQAMQEFETAVQLDPNNITGLMGRGMSMLMAPPPFGNLDVAVSDFQKVVELEPNHVDGHFHLGVAYQKKGEIEKAKAEFEKTLQLKPDHANAKAELEKLSTISSPLKGEGKGEGELPAPSADGKKKYGESWYEEQNGFSILHLKGSPYDMGYQQGMLIKDGMGMMTEADAHQIFGLDEQTLPQIQEATKRIDKFIPEEYREQMRGLADALEISYDEILLWNTLADVMMAHNCTNFLAFGKATADGKVIHGANLEFGYDIVTNRMMTNNGNMAWLVVYEPDDGHKFAMVTPVPMMVWGYYGINDAGLTSSLTQLPAKDNTIEGMPTMMLLRKVIQYADSVPNALKIVQETPRAWGASMMFADGKTNQGAVIECSATQHVIREPVDEALVATNRMADKKLYEAMEKGALSDDFEKGMSLREQRYGQMFKTNVGKIDVSKAVDFLRDHLDLSTGKNTISFPVAIGSAGIVSSVVFRPADFNFWVARGAVPMVYGEFIGFNLKALLAGEKSEITPARILRDAYLDSEEFKMELKKAEEEAYQRRKR